MSEREEKQEEEERSGDQEEDAMDVDEPKSEVKGKKHAREEEGTGEDERPAKTMRVEYKLDEVKAELAEVKADIMNVTGDVAVKVKQRDALDENSPRFQRLDKEIHELREKESNLREEKNTLREKKNKLREKENKLLEMQSKRLDQRLSPPRSRDPYSVLQEVVRELSGKRAKQRAYPFSFLGRDAEFRQVSAVAAANFAHRNTTQNYSHQFVLVPGGPGIGKTRFAHELQHRLRHFISPEGDPLLTAALQNPLYLLVDLNNGMQYLKFLDSVHPPSVLMGVRLLKAYFGGDIDLGTMCSAIGSNLQYISTRYVLSKLIAEERKSRGPEAPICLLIHVDEYQFYISRAQEAENVSLTEARNMFKDLLKQIGAFMMHDSKLEWDRNVFILPVCSGISEIDTTFLPNEYGKDVVRLPPLSRDEAMEMANEKYAADPAWPNTRTQNHFQIALSDTGYIPRYLEFLLEPAHCTITDWGDQLYLNVSEFYGDCIGALSPAMGQAALLALAAETVTGDMVVKNVGTLSELERTGLLFLSRAGFVEEGYYIVQMPFVQLKLVNTSLANKQLRSLFPNDSLFFPSNHRPWKWDDFELMLPHFHVAMCRALSELFGVRFGGKFKLGQLLRGCLGSSALLNLEVRLEESGVFHEDTEFLPTLDAVADVVKSIDCDGVAVDIFSGTFVCRTGNSFIDFRTYFRPVIKNRKPVALFFQIKHSGVNIVGNKITLASLKAWHQQCTISLAEVAKKYQVGCVLVTNRDVELPDEADWPENLLVISRDQLATYLGPLAHRGLLADQQ